MNSIVTPQTNYFPQWSSSAEIESQAMVARYGIVATGVVSTVSQPIWILIIGCSIDMAMGQLDMHSGGFQAV